MFQFDLAWDIQQTLNQLWWPINIGLLIILVIIGYLGYKRTELAVGLTIILLPTYLFRSSILGIPFTFLELCILVLFFSWIIKSAQKKQFKNCFKCSYHWPIILILVSASLSVLIAPDLKVAAGLWKAYFVEPILFFLILIKVWPDNKKTILWSLGISTLGISLLAIAQKFTAFGIYEPSWINPSTRRTTSLFSSPNAVGLYLAPIITIYVGWIIAEFKNYKATILKSVIVILGLIAIIFTRSIGTLLGLGGAVVFLLFFAYPPKLAEGKRRWGWNKKITVGVMSIMAIISLMIPQLRPIMTLQDQSGQNRLELWSLASTELTSNIKNFSLGLGLFGFSEIQNSNRDPLKIEPLLYPHNIILNFWTELGLLGLVGFGWVIIKFFKQGLGGNKWQMANGKWLTLGIMAAMITILVHGLIDVPYFKNDLAILFWIIIVLI